MFDPTRCRSRDLVMADPLIIRLVGADMPWISFDEDVYACRYIENTLIDRTRFGTSAEWGAHALGTIPAGPATVSQQRAPSGGRDAA
jgi:hypothetical protein